MLDPFDLAQRFQRALLTIRDRTAATAATAWDRHGGVDDAALAAFLASVTPIVNAGQRAAAGLSVSYIASYTGAVTGAPAITPPIDVVAVLDTLRAGTPATEVYTRPVVEARTMLKRSSSYDAAFSAARARVLQTANTDVMLASRSATDAAMRAESRVVGYRRVPDGGACKFCLLASTQRYHLGDLMPLHPACGCTIAPIIGRHDPGHVINRGLLDRLKSIDPELTVREQNNLARSFHELTTVHVHGELGPVLAPAGEHFTGPQALAA